MERARSVLGASFESGVRTVKKASGDGNLRARVLCERSADMGELRRLMFDGAVGVKPPRVLFPLVLVKHRSFERNARRGRWLVQLAIGEDEFCIFGSAGRVIYRVGRPCWSREASRWRRK